MRLYTLEDIENAFEMCLPDDMNLEDQKRLKKDFLAYLKTPEDDRPPMRMFPDFRNGTPFHPSQVEGFHKLDSYDDTPPESNVVCMPDAFGKTYEETVAHGRSATLIGVGPRGDETVLIKSLSEALQFEPINGVNTKLNEAALTLFKELKRIEQTSAINKLVSWEVGTDGETDHVTVTLKSLTSGEIDRGEFSADRILDYTSSFPEWLAESVKHFRKEAEQ